jgi:RNA polymerase sigma-70 factor (ECF subfamily)
LTHALLALTGFAGLAVAVRAAAATPASRLVYLRSPDALACGDEAVLRGAVARRFGYDPVYPWARRTVVVQISRAEKRYRAQVQIVDEGGVSHGGRDITSDRESCDELLDATALAISIALDANMAAPSPSPPTESAAPSASASPPPAEPPPPPPLAPLPPPPPPPAPASSGAETTSVSPPPSAPTAIPSSAPPVPFFGVDLLASVGMAPSPSAGMALFGGIRWAVWSVALELRADAPAGESADVGSGSVSSWLALAGVAPCLHAGWASFCAVGELGTLQAQGAGVTNPASGSTLLAFAGLRAGAELALSGSVALRARAEGLMNLHQPTLDLGSLEVWRAPVVAGTLGLGVTAPDLRAIFDAHFDYVWITLRRLGVRDSDLEDVAHEVFLKVHARLHDYDQARPIRPWLFGFAFRVASDHQRLARHRVEVVGLVSEPVDAACGADQQLEADDERRLVEAALQCVETERRAVLLMHDVDEVPIPEVARALEINVNTAYSRLRLARRDLAEAIQRLRLKEGGS